MKKCIIAGLAVALAVGAQAASIDWSNNGGAGVGITIDGVTLVAPGTAVYLVYLGANGVLDTPTGAAAWAGDDVAVDSTTTLGAPNKGGFSKTFGFTWNEPGNYGQGDSFLVVAFSGDGTKYGTGGSLTLPAGDNTYNSTLASSTFSTATFTVVPEPTSFALLGLGAAALALRRRLRK